jgi:septum formation protein
MRVILASASPRRHQLLRQVVDDFEIRVADLDEEAYTVADPYATAQLLAAKKAEKVFGELGQTPVDTVVIGCDTVVALRQGDAWVQFAKPVDADDAMRMLQVLRGKTHVVITGVAMLRPYGSSSSFAEAQVTFHEVSDDEIQRYVETGEPMDKAGAYGAQGMGGFLVKEIIGSQDTVIGLPVALVRTMLLGS